MGLSCTPCEDDLRHNLEDCDDLGKKLSGTVGDIHTQCKNNCEWFCGNFGACLSGCYGICLIERTADAGVVAVAIKACQIKAFATYDFCKLQELAGLLPDEAFEDCDCKP